MSERAGVQLRANREFARPRNEVGLIGSRGFFKLERRVQFLRSGHKKIVSRVIFIILTGPESADLQHISPFSIQVSIHSLSG